MKNIKKLTPTLLLPLALAGCASCQTVSDLGYQERPEETRDVGWSASSPEYKLEEITMEEAAEFNWDSLIHDFITGVDDRLNINFYYEHGFTRSETYRFLRFGGTEDFLERLVGATNFTRPRDILEYSRLDGTVEFAKQLTTLDFEPYDTVRLRRMRRTIDYVHGLDAIRSPEGEPLFDERLDVVRLAWGYGSVEEAERLASLGFSAEKMVQLIRYRRVGLTTGDEFPEFEDTERPNALILYPAEDFNGVFDHPSATYFFSGVVENYDTLMPIVRQDEEALSYITNQDLVVFVGHGTPESIQLSGYNGRYSIPGEEDLIDETDEGLQRLQTLPEDVRVVLIACSTARHSDDETVEEAATIANTIRDHLADVPGAIFYAATETLYPSRIEVLEWNPMRVIFSHNFNEGEDITYTNDVPVSEE